MSYSDNDWRYYVQNFLSHADQSMRTNIEGQKLYLPGLKLGDSENSIIRKGTSMDGLLVILGDEEEESELAHHGIKGQRWGVRNGPPYPLKEGRSDFTLKKGKKLTRYSDKEENTIRKNTYASYTRNDVKQYAIDLGTGNLGAKDVKEIYTIKLSTKEDVKVRSGRSMVLDAVKGIANDEVTHSFEVLDNEGYFSDNPDTYTRWKIWNKNDETRAARKMLGSAIHQYIYEDRKGFSNKYKSQGYGAIVDPEDFVWNYESPLIITDQSKFQIDDISHRKNTYTREDKY